MEGGAYGAKRRATMSNHGKWSQPGVPHKGWRCVGAYDSCENGEEMHLVCEMCEHKAIRYVQVMEHDNYPKRLTCGRICAGRMEEDYDAAKSRDDKLKREAKRKKKAEPRALEEQIAQGWKKSGTSWRASCQCGKATVFPNDGGFQIRWARRGYPVTFGDETFTSVGAAKKAAAREMGEWI